MQEFTWPFYQCVLFWLVSSFSGCSLSPSLVPAVLLMLFFVLFWPSMLFWLFGSDSSGLAVLFLLSCSRCSVAYLCGCSLSCVGCSLSCSGHYICRVLAVICPVLAVLFWFFSGFSGLAVLLWFLCSGCHILEVRSRVSCSSCSDCPVLIVLCSGGPILAATFWLAGRNRGTDIRIRNTLISREYRIPYTTEF